MHYFFGIKHGDVRSEQCFLLSEYEVLDAGCDFIFNIQAAYTPWLTGSMNRSI